MKRLAARIIAGLGLLVVVAGVQAAAVRYQFTGSGELCNYSSSGEACVDKHFTGAVTVNVLADGPAGPDSVTDSVNYAKDLNGWVDSTFRIRWGGGSFSPGPVQNQFLYQSYAEVLNDWGLFLFDQLKNAVDYQGSVEGRTFYEGALLQRGAQGLDAGGQPLVNWLNDLSFNTSVGLAPGTPFDNFILFSNASWLTDSFGQHYEIRGYSGRIYLSTLTPHPVAEPGSVALLTLGLAGLAFTRRRKQ